MPNHSGKPLVPREGTLRRVLIIFAIAGIALIGLYLLRSFASALILMFAGVLFGIFLHGTAVLVSQWLPLSFRWCLALVFGVLIAICIAFILLAGPLLVHQVQVLAERLPESIQLIRSRMQHHEWGRTILTVLPSLQKSPTMSPAAALGSVSHVFINAMEVLGALVFIVFVGVYLAGSPGEYRRGLLLLLPREHRARGEEVLSALNVALQWWLLGRAVTMTVMAILTTIALWLTNIPLALVLGIIAGLLLFVPYLGAVAAAIPAILVALVQSPAKAIWVAVIYTGIHVFEGYCITPFVQKRAVSVPPALLLAVQIVAALLFGVIGIIFSTPLLVVAIVLVQTLYLQDVLGEPVAVLGDHNSKTHGAG